MQAGEGIRIIAAANREGKDILVAPPRGEWGSFQNDATNSVKCSQIQDSLEHRFQIGLGRDIRLLR